MRSKILKQVVFYAILAGAWQAVALARFWPEYVFPSPTGVAESLWATCSDASLLVAVGASLRRIALGYSISVVCGVALGILLCKSALLDETVGRLALGLQTLPSICWLPLAVLWFGLSETAITFVVVMGALFSILIATDAGIRNVPKLYTNVGINMGAKRFRLFWTITLPAALPSMLYGFKQGWSFAWRSLMAGEILFMTLGVGQLLQMGRELNDMNRVVAMMLVITFIGLLVDYLIFGRVLAVVRRRWGLA